MGGKAFSSYDHPINIVRLSPSDYFLLRDHVLSTLRPLYERVACPTAAPAKSFHGDVDILVTSPLPKRVSLNIEPDANSTSAAGHQPDHLLAIQCHLQAPYLHRSKPTSSFAVPHPVIPDAFAQVDIHVVPSDASFDWLLMHQSHGDFWIIVARALRSLGFSVTDTGLYLRDPTIATYDYGKKFLLTDDPMEVLSFLELDPGLFFRDASFESLEAMFRYISGMRWFHLDSFKSNSDAGMTSKEKKKLATRAQYRDFCQAWVPNQDSSISKVIPTREEALAGILARFDKSEQWEEWKTAWWVKFWEDVTHQSLKRERKELSRSENDYCVAWIDFLGRGISEGMPLIQVARLPERPNRGML